MAYAATTVRNGTTTTINLTGAWGAGLPNTSTVAKWDTGSNTTSVLATTNATWGAIEVGAGFGVAGTTYQTFIAATNSFSISLAGLSDGTKTYLIDCRNMVANIFICRPITFAGDGIIDVPLSRYVLTENTLTGAAARTITKNGDGTWLPTGNSSGLSSTIIWNGAGRANGGATNPLGTGPLIINGPVDSSGVPVPGSTTGLGTNGLIDVTYSNSSVTVNVDNLDIAPTAGKTITFSGTTFALGSTPKTLNVVTGASVISGVITGTAGFTKAGAGDLNIMTAVSTLSGTVTVSASRLFIGSYNSGTPNMLPSVTGMDIPASTAEITHLGNTAYTEDAVVSGTGTFWSQNRGGITFTDPSVSSFTGRFRCYTEGTIGATAPGPLQIFPYFPGTTSALGMIAAASGTAPAIATQRFTHGSPGVHAGDIYMTTSVASSTGGVYVMEDNGTASSEFTGQVLKGGGASSIGTLQLAGTNTSSKISGLIKEATASGVLAINKQGTGKWTLSNPANAYSNATTVYAGTLAVSGSTAASSTYLGAATGGVTVSSGATLELLASAGDGISVNKGSATLSLSGTGQNSNGALYSSAGNNTLTVSSVTLGTATADVKVAPNTTLTLSATSGISAASAYGIRVVGGGTLVLALGAASSFTGAVNIANGTLEVRRAMAAGGAASAIGQAGTAASNWLIGSSTTAGTFRYAGTTSTSTDRAFTIGTAGCKIDASGTATNAVLSLTGAAPSFSGTGACTLELAGSAGDATTPNTISAALANNSADALSLLKSGAGAWKLNTQPTYTGTTTLSGGTLSLSNNNLATNVTFSGTSVLRDVVLTKSNATINCNASGAVAELVAASAGTATGSTNVTAGTLKLTTDTVVDSKPAKILGETAVTVNSAAILRTTNSATQRGRMRYKSLNLTSGSILQIG